MPATYRTKAFGDVPCTVHYSETVSGRRVTHITIGRNNASHVQGRWMVDAAKVIA